MKRKPVFIHSLFRSGSTYFFTAFRRADGFWCYQESLHEMAFFSKNNVDDLQKDFGEEASLILRHPSVGQGYFYELAEVWSEWKEVITEAMIYDSYFPEKKNDEISLPYLKALINSAKARPVFQECRTSGRINTIKKGVGGYHIYLWRNPWDQWWSYKATPYFDVANQLIIHSSNAPKSVCNLLDELQLIKSNSDDLRKNMDFYTSHPLTSEESYLVFYMLWCLAFRSGLDDSHLMINVDRLSNSSEYKNEVINAMKHDADITGIDFSDCRIPQARYDHRDIAFFSTLEERVHQWLLQDDWSEEDIEKLKQLREDNKPDLQVEEDSTPEISSITEQSSRARDLALRFETDLALQTRSSNEEIKQTQAKAEQAEAQAAQAKAQQSEARTQQSETKAEQAEARAQQSETKAEQAEARAQQSEARAQQSEARAQQSEARAQQSEARAQQSEARAQQSEARAQQSETEAEQAEARASQAEAKVLQVEVELAGVYNSRSWRITAPLRWAVHQVRLLPSNEYKTWFKVAFKKLANRVFKATFMFVNTRPRLRNKLVMVASKIGIYDGMKVLYHRLQKSPVVKIQMNNSTTVFLHELTPQARHIYADLNSAINEKKEQK